MVATFGGPEAMFGWIIGAILALADGLIWAELGAAMPGAGGTYIYLREAFQYRTGRLMPFLFVWSAVLFIPLIMSTGIIGLVQYLGYLIPGVTDDSGNTALGKVIGVGITLRDHGGAVPQDRPDRQAHDACCSSSCWSRCSARSSPPSRHFSGAQAFAFTPGAFSFGDGTFWAGLGAGLIIAIYDYLGYNTTAYLGAEMRDPGRTIPRSIVFSILGIMSLYFLLQIGVLGAMPLEELKNATSVASTRARAGLGIGHCPGDHGADRRCGHRLGVRRSARRVPRSVRSGPRQGVPAGVRQIASEAESAHRRGAHHGRDHDHRLAVHADHDHQRGGCDAWSSFSRLPRWPRSSCCVAASRICHAPTASGCTRCRRSSRWSAGSTSMFPRPGFRSACPCGWIAIGCIAFLIYAKAEHTWPFGPKEIKEAFAETRQ